MKKILSMIIITLILILPFNVNAESCPTKTNYYFLHIGISEWDQNPAGVYSPADCLNGKSLTTCYNRIFYSKEIEAHFEDTIGAAEILDDKDNLIDDVNDYSEITLEEYHEIWMDMLSDSVTEKTYRSDPNTTYLIHDINPDSLKGIEYDDITLNNYLNSDNDRFNITEATGTVEYNEDDGEIIIKTLRNFDFDNTDGKAFNNGYDNNLDTSGTNMTLIYPLVYKITYKEDDCYEEEQPTTYKVKYYENDGTNNYKSYTVDDGEEYRILDYNDLDFEREGYTFVGWSTNSNASQASSTYQAGKTIEINNDLTLYAVWQNAEGTKPGDDEEPPITGLGYSIGILGTILAGTGAGVIYFKKRNKFENI